MLASLGSGKGAPSPREYPLTAPGLTDDPSPGRPKAFLRRARLATINGSTSIANLTLIAQFDFGLDALLRCLDAQGLGGYGQ